MIRSCSAALLVLAMIAYDVAAQGSFVYVGTPNDNDLDVNSTSAGTVRVNGHDIVGCQSLLFHLNLAD